MTHTKAHVVILLDVGIMLLRNMMFFVKREDITYDHFTCIAASDLNWPSPAMRGDGKGGSMGKDGGKRHFITATSPNLTYQVFAETPYSNFTMTANKPTKGRCLFIRRESM